MVRTDIDHRGRGEKNAVSERILSKNGKDDIRNGVTGKEFINREETAKREEKCT